MSNSLDSPDWRAIPGVISACSILSLLLIGTYNQKDDSISTTDYLFGEYGVGTEFWTTTIMTTASIFIIYSVKTERDFPRYALSVLGVIIVVTELRFDINIFTKIIGILLSLLLLSVLLFRVLDEQSAKTNTGIVKGEPESLFELVVVSSLAVLIMGTITLVMSVLLGTSPLLGDMAGSRIGIMYLVGPEVAHDEFRNVFRASMVALMFAAIVADAVRHRAVRWLALITLIIGIAGTSFFLYFTFWTATVAAVGALLTVIVVALVLDERTETTLS